MKYVEPLNSAQYPSRDGHYVTAVPSQGIGGSTVPGPAIENPMREIIAVIQAAGLTPEDGDLTQLLQAIEALMPGVEPGMKLVAGMPLWQPGQTLLPNCRWGNRALVLLADWPELRASVDAGYLDILASTATTAAKAASPRYWVWNSAGTGLYLPDIGGRFPRDWRSGQTDDSGRASGSRQEDAIREITGSFQARPGGTSTAGAITTATGCLTYSLQTGSSGASPISMGSGSYRADVVSVSAAKVVPTAAENRPINDAVPVAIYMGKPA